MVRQSERSTSTIQAILAAAHKLFAAQGFEATSIDDIAVKAGVAKGAVYHHFSSKEDIFTRVLDGVQQKLSVPQMPAKQMRELAKKISDPLDQIIFGVVHYLEAATQPGIKQILLIDGPAVIGWTKWREIDDRYFGAGTRIATATLLGPKASEREVDTTARLLLGAVMEAALVCATAPDAKKAARELCAALRKMLEGLRG
jgi:AcrR family transcriptional regulator